MVETERLDFEFQRAGLPIAVRAELWANDEPAAYGCPEFARGFPVMRATIAGPTRGYQDLLGWIQLIRTPPEFGERFHLDSVEMLGEVSHPFGYFGLAPTMYDAPHRDVLPDMDWVAHTFLGGIAGIYKEFEAHAHIGFSWGYAIRDGAVSVTGLAELGPEAWDAHLPYLGATCPAWTFTPGYAP